MILKFQELNKKRPPRNPEEIIKESFAKSNAVYEKTKPWVEQNLNRVYQPEEFEFKVKKILWLKNICFLILGIEVDHKVGITFFTSPKTNQSVRNC